MGNPGKQKLPAETIKPVLGDGPPPPPEHLGPVAAGEWRRLARTMWLNACLGDMDLQTFALVCELFEDWQKAKAALAKQEADERATLRAIIDWEGADPSLRGERPMVMTSYGALVSHTTNGNQVQNPLVGILNTCRMNYLKAAQNFGLTPSSRVGLDLGGGEAPKPSQTPAQSYLNRGPRENVVPLKPA